MCLSSTHKNIVTKNLEQTLKLILKKALIKNQLENTY